MKMNCLVLKIQFLSNPENPIQLIYHDRRIIRQGILYENVLISVITCEKSIVYSLIYPVCKTSITYVHAHTHTDIFYFIVFIVLLIT